MNILQSESNTCSLTFGKRLKIIIMEWCFNPNSFKTFYESIYKQILWC